MDEPSIRFWITVSLAGLVFHGLAAGILYLLHAFAVISFGCTPPSGSAAPGRASCSSCLQSRVPPCWLESSLMPCAMLVFVPLALIGYRYAGPLHARLQPSAGAAAG